MNKIALFLAGFTLLTASAMAQINWGDYSQSFPEAVQDDKSTVGLILNIRKENNAFWKIQEKSRYFDTLNNDPTFRRLRPHKIVARTTFDTARAHFFLNGVGPQNAGRFQFRLTEYPGNRVVVPWHRVDHFADSTLTRQSGIPRMAYLGGYRTDLGKMLIMDVKTTDNDQIIGTSMIAWEPIRPVITNIYTSETIDQFFQQLQSPWQPDDQSPGHFSPVFTVPSTNTNLIFALQDGAFSKQQIQYELLRDGSIHRPWRYNDYSNSFVWLKDTPPGQYTIRIRYTAQPQHVTEYRFNVTPAWYQTNWFRGLVSIATLALLSLGFLFVRQQRKIRQEQTDKLGAQLELKALYAQLNPHFVFNALSSIQGLVNRQDIAGANRYLADFARLLRESLSHSHKDVVPLPEELRMLNTYLTLEQLRFGFQYAIRVDETINAAETDIPVLLVQPLVENAVKHGVGSLPENGYIDLHVSRSGNTLIVTVTDNGPGFTESNVTAGMGLKLTRDRIDLLNKLHPDGSIMLTIGTATPSGTQSTLTFTHWF